MKELISDTMQILPKTSIYSLIKFYTRFHKKFSIFEGFRSGTNYSEQSEQIFKLPGWDMEKDYVR